jgi:hypothetical protein
MDRSLHRLELTKPATVFTMTDFPSVPAAGRFSALKKLVPTEEFLIKKREAFLNSEKSDGRSQKINPGEVLNSTLAGNILDYIQFLKNYSRDTAAIRIDRQLEAFTPSCEDHIRKDYPVRFKDREGTGWQKTKLSKVRTANIRFDIDTLMEMNPGDKELAAHLDSLQDMIGKTLSPHR